MSPGTEYPGPGVTTAPPGRHRRGSAAGWTPPVPPRRPTHHHRDDTAPIDPPVSGSLPLPPSLPQPRDRRPLFPPSQGSLPLPVEDLVPPVKRTRVTLATPAPEPEPDDDVRVYAAPPIDGLGGFTIGCIPASVTPPKTWRKAAWFATGASGAVVVGLLFAGSFLVGKPPADDQALPNAWPGYQGAPVVTGDPTGAAQPPGRGGPGSTDPRTTGGTESSSRAPGGGAGPEDGVASPPAPGTTSGPAATGTPKPSGPPQKPPVTPAQRETPVRPTWYQMGPDAQAMGDNTEKFLNTVTTDPNTASSVTSGDLHDRGPQALAERYRGIAYFEVKKITIDQERGVTVNTVEVTHTDGTKTIEQRTLTFGDDAKITGDGQ